MHRAADSPCTGARNKPGGRTALQHRSILVVQHHSSKASVALHDWAIIFESVRGMILYFFKLPPGSSAKVAIAGEAAVGSPDQSPRWFRVLKNSLVMNHRRKVLNDLK